MNPPAPGQPVPPATAQPGKYLSFTLLRIRFGLPDPVDHDRTCIVVAQVPAAGGGSRPYGVIVDGVEEVTAYAADDLVPPPDFGTAIDTRFITGMARSGAGVTTLIDLEAIARADREHV